MWSCFSLRDIFITHLSRFLSFEEHLRDPRTTQGYCLMSRVISCTVHATQIRNTLFESWNKHVAQYLLHVHVRKELGRVVTSVPITCYCKLPYIDRFWLIYTFLLLAVTGPHKFKQWVIPFITRAVYCTVSVVISSRHYQKVHLVLFLHIL